jgi:ubiquinone/menaquinone biosynthesis C-methylase UbiE
MNPPSTSVCDYADTDYEKEFWKGEVDRSYEDRSEKELLAKLLPLHGRSLIDIGAGFGRLATIYKSRFRKVVLLDYSENLLNQARAVHREDPHLEYIKASCYEMPFLPDTFETAISFRLMHHIEDVPRFLKEAYRILKPGGLFVLEFANKKNVLEVVRYVMGKSEKKPFAMEPYRYGEKVFYNFHPAYIKKIVKETGFTIKAKYSISNFRQALFKKWVGTRPLVEIDKLLRRPLAIFDFGPSLVLVLNKPMS